MTQQSHFQAYTKDIYQKETKIEKNTYIQMSTAELFTTARTWKQMFCRCLSTDNG